MHIDTRAHETRIETTRCPAQYIAVFTLSFERRVRETAIRYL